jgi:hypothetical protein
MQLIRLRPNGNPKWVSIHLSPRGLLLPLCARKAADREILQAVETSVCVPECVCVSVCDTVCV